MGLDFAKLGIDTKKTKAFDFQPNTILLELYSFKWAIREVSFCGISVLAIKVSSVHVLLRKLKPTFWLFERNNKYPQIPHIYIWFLKCTSYDALDFAWARNKLLNCYPNTTLPESYLFECSEAGDYREFSVNISRFNYLVFLSVASIVIEQ